MACMHIYYMHSRMIAAKATKYLIHRRCIHSSSEQNTIKYYLYIFLIICTCLHCFKFFVNYFRPKNSLTSNPTFKNPIYLFFVFIYSLRQYVFYRHEHKRTPERTGSNEQKLLPRERSFSCRLWGHPQEHTTTTAFR